MYMVNTFNDGHAALELSTIAREPLALILLRNELPGMTSHGD